MYVILDNAGAVVRDVHNFMQELKVKMCLHAVVLALCLCKCILYLGTCIWLVIHIFHDLYYNCVHDRKIIMRDFSYFMGGSRVFLRFPETNHI